MAEEIKQDDAQSSQDASTENKEQKKEEPSQVTAQLKAELEAEKIRRIRAESVAQRLSERKKKDEDDYSQPFDEEALKVAVGSVVEEKLDAKLDSYLVDSLAKRNVAEERAARLEKEMAEFKASWTSKENKSSGSPAGRETPQEEKEESLTPTEQYFISQLREKYVVNAEAIRRIKAGEKLFDLEAQGVVKKR